METAVLGASLHNGWAELVALGAGAGSPLLLDRWRARLVGFGVPANPFHHEGLALPLPQAEAVLRRTIASVLEHTDRALTEVTGRWRVAAVVLEQSPYDALPDSLEEVLRSYHLTCAADGMLYRETFARRAAAMGLAVERYPRRTDVIGRAAAALGIGPREVEDLLARMGRSVGPPWRKEHRLVAAAALPALARAVDPPPRVP